MLALFQLSHSWSLNTFFVLWGGLQCTVLWRLFKAYLPAPKILSCFAVKFLSAFHSEYIRSAHVPAQGPVCGAVVLVQLPSGEVTILVAFAWVFSRDSMIHRASCQADVRWMHWCQLNTYFPFAQSLANPSEDRKHADTISIIRHRRFHRRAFYLLFHSPG